MASKLLVNELQAATGSEITIAVGTSLTGGTNVFKITGGLAGQSLITDGAGNISFGAAIPSVTGQSGKFLTTDGTVTSWDTVDALPSQTGQAGEYLQTDGTTATWEAVDALPSQTGQAGEYLQTDGTTATWEAVTSATATAVSDQANTSTGYFDVPAGTTAQRPGSPAVGNMRWNTTDEALEHYSGSAGGWIQWGGAAPTITGITPTTSAISGTSITVNGINFQAGSIVKLIGNDGTNYNAVSTTFISATEVSFTTPELPVSNEPYDVKLTLPAGGFFVLPDALDAGGVPVWTTAAGNLGTVNIAQTGNHFTLVATDPDSQTVTFSMDTANTAILTSAGLTLNGTTGVISGDPTNVGSATTYAFDVIATDSTGINSTTRSFSIIVDDPAGNQEYTTAGSYTWTVPDAVLVAHVICVGAGGGGGCSNSGQGGGGGALAYRNTIAVVPGQTADIVVGASGLPGSSSETSGTAGGDSTFTYDSVTTIAGGGGGGHHLDSSPGGPGGTQQGTYTAGYSGGAGGRDPANYGGPGGGGAAGYTGDGGAGANPSSGGSSENGSNGSGGGGGGGGKGGQTEAGGGGGGGVGLYGTGSSGSGGTGNGSNDTHGGGGGGGSGGDNGGSGENTGGTSANNNGGTGGNYGGGQGGTQSSGTAGQAAGGAVRIIWGPGRNFPSNAAQI